MQCPNCGGTIAPNSNRCLKCGSVVQEAPSPPPQQAPAQQQNMPPGVFQGPPKSRMAAGLLGIFLGGLGIHRFYLGHTGLGVAMLVLQIFGWITSVFCIGFFISIGVGLWGFVEGILILAGTINTDAAGRPLQ